MSLVQNPMHPGEVLKELYLKPLEMSAIALAKRLGVPRTRIERLVKCETRMTTDTALRLSKVSGTTPAYWMNMQVNHDLVAAQETADVSGIKPLVTMSRTDRGFYRDGLAKWA